jgi:hypothetical protein
VLIIPSSWGSQLGSHLHAITSLRRLAWWWRRPPVMIPLSGKVPGRASGPSRSRDDDGGGLQYVSWKSVCLFRVFLSKGIYRWKGDVRGWIRGPHHVVAWPWGWPAPPYGAAASGPPLSLLWNPSLCQVNRNFGFRFVEFREYFLCNFSETQK